MFERFTDGARRALFFALANAVERGDNTISSQDLLHGIAMAVPSLAARFAPGRTDGISARETEEDLMFRLQNEDTSSGRPTEGIPFSATAKLALERAVDEANELGHTAVRPEHLVLGLLRDEHTQAWQTLHQAGVSLRDVRRILKEGGDAGHNP
jgi:ATP-dependent Clp protease ATP-binding subunit ClpC